MSETLTLKSLDLDTAWQIIVQLQTYGANPKEHAPRMPDVAPAVQSYMETADGARTVHRWTWGYQGSLAHLQEHMSEGPARTEEERDRLLTMCQRILRGLIDSLELHAARATARK